MVEHSDANIYKLIEEQVSRMSKSDWQDFVETQLNFIYFDDEEIFQEDWEETFGEKGI